MDQSALKGFGGHDWLPDATDQLQVEYSLAERSGKPAWLEALLTDKFFAACPMHGDLKKNENNIFCVQCCRSICHHCSPTHRSHHLLQVRRYVYNDVIRLQDMQRLVNCSCVQTYIINNARVVFLKQRAQSRPAKGFSNYCETCERSLQESYRYCCIACKVESVLNRGQNLSTLLQSSSKPLPFFSGTNSFGGPRVGEAQPEERFSCGDSVLDCRLSSLTPRSSATSIDTEFAVSKSQSMRPSPDRMDGRSRLAGPTLSPVNRRTRRKRRKGVPHRSPIC